MSIPSPATFAKQINEKKAAALLQSSSDQKPDSSPSRSSVKGKARGTSSNPARTTTRVNSKSSPSSQSSTPSTATPTPPLKKPFERKPHLTQRLTSNEELRALRDSLTSSTSKQK